MNVFSQRPQRTWKIIYESLHPHLNRMGGKASNYNRLIQEISDKFKIEDFNDRPLSGLYLLGYSSQRNDLYTSKKDKEAAAATPEDHEENQSMEQGDN